MSNKPDPKRKNKIVFLIAFAVFVVSLYLSQFTVLSTDLHGNDTVLIAENFEVSVCDIGTGFNQPNYLKVCLKDVGQDLTRSELPDRVAFNLGNASYLQFRNPFQKPYNLPLKVSHATSSSEPPLTTEVFFDVPSIPGRELPKDLTFILKAGDAELPFSYGSTLFGYMARLLLSFCLFAVMMLGFTEPLGEDKPGRRERKHFDHQDGITDMKSDDEFDIEMFDREGGLKEWDPQNIALQMSSIQDDPRMVAKLVASIRQRFVINQDAKTQEIRTAWLENQLKQLKVANEYVDEAIKARGKRLEAQIAHLKQIIELAKLKKERTDELDENLRELEKTNRKLTEEVEIAEKKRRIRDLQTPEQEPRVLSDKDKLRLKIQTLQDEIDRLKSKKLRKVEEESDESEKRRIENFYSDQITAKQKELVELEGQL